MADLVSEYRLYPDTNNGRPVIILAASRFDADQPSQTSDACSSTGLKKKLHALVFVEFEHTCTFSIVVCAIMSVGWCI